MHVVRRLAHLLFLAGTLAAPARAELVDPLRSGEATEVRLFLGRLDGAENTALLRDDGHHYTVGLGASAPIALGESLEVNLEAWLNERAYAATTTATGVATGGVTLQTLSLAYGLRLQRGSGDWRPYAVAALGLQGSRLRAARRDDPEIEAIDEQTLEPLLQVGAGMEWRLGRDIVALDWRRWLVRSDFSEVGAKELEVGGDFVGISLGHRW